jgi:hypothetical protein
MRQVQNPEKTSSDWLYVEITKDLEKMSIWEFYGRPKKRI